MPEPVGEPGSCNSEPQEEAVELSQAGAGAEAACEAGEIIDLEVLVLLNQDLGLSRSAARNLLMVPTAA